MELTSSNNPADAAPQTGQQLVELIRTQRQNAGTVFLVFGVVFLALAVFLALKAFRTPGAEPGKDKDAEKTADKMFPDTSKDKSKPAFEPANVKRGEYNAGWLGCLAGSLLMGTAGAWLMAGTPPPTDQKQRKEVRVLLLAVGGAFGAGLIVFGLGFFYLWSDSLTRWLDKNEVREARWVLYPLLMIVAGAGVVFVAIQPARAEERHDPLIRKMVYGSNFALVALLLVVVLVIANVVFALKVPNKLDTTETNFYTLSPATEKLLTELDPSITAHAIMPDTTDPQANDIQQLLLACQDASAGRFKVKFLDEVANKNDVSSLLRKYPQLERALSQGTTEDELAGAVLLLSDGPDGRAAVIPNREFFTSEGREPKFTGESKLFKELAFLNVGQNRPVIYFTQSNGELALAGGAEADRSATRFRSYLERNNYEVRPLTFPENTPDLSVPDDAAVVVVADPRKPFSTGAIGALRKYMSNPAKKGKLLVLAGAESDPLTGKMLNTGLDAYLAELNVQLSNQFLFSLPLQVQIPPNAVVARFARDAERNPILQTVIRLAPAILFVDPREVTPLPAANTTFEVNHLMSTDGLTWLDDQQPVDFGASIKEMVESKPIQRARRLTESPRSVAVIVSERGTSRAAVFGTATFISDRVGQRGSQATPPSFDLIGVSIDWLRERPSGVTAEIEGKKYSHYLFPRPTASSVDTFRLRWLPLGLAILFVAGVGAGVWVIRRK